MTHVLAFTCDVLRAACDVLSRATCCVLSCATCCVLVALALASGLPAQTPQTMRVSVDVSVEVEDFGTPPKLEASDFEIRAWGQQMPVSAVTVNKQPLRLILLLDLSSSITRRIEKGTIKDHVRDMFIDHLQPGEEARIGGFARDLRLSPLFTRDRRTLQRGLDAALAHREENTYGPSPIWDATYQALDGFADAAGRKSVVILTDGRATGNRRGIEDVVEHAVRMGATINVISLDRQLYIQQDAATAVVVRPRNVLLWMAEVTGGQVITMIHEPREPMGPAVALDRLLAALRRVYTLEFEAPVAEGRFHKIEVVVKHPSATVRAPKVFYSASSSPPPAPR